LSKVYIDGGAGSDFLHVRSGIINYTLYDSLGNILYVAGTGAIGGTAISVFNVERIIATDIHDEIVYTKNY
jgi:hypothetical protein